MSETYTQCKLRSGATEKTAWIPTRYAKAGKVVEIGGRGPAQLETRSWEVVSCGATLDAEYVEGHERDYRNAFASI